MEDKFDLVEDFRSPKHSKSDINVVPLAVQEDWDDNDNDWRPKYYDASEHPLQMMVCQQQESINFTIM